MPEGTQRRRLRRPPAGRAGGGQRAVGRRRRGDACSWTSGSISTSAVRCVGSPLILQGRAYSPPYTVTAIGDQRSCWPALDDLPRRWQLPRLRAADRPGLRGARPSATTTMPGYDGALDLTYARVPLVSVVRAITRGLGELFITAGPRDPAVLRLPAGLDQRQPPTGPPTRWSASCATSGRPGASAGPAATGAATGAGPAAVAARRRASRSCTSRGSARTGSSRSSRASTCPTWPAASGHYPKTAAARRGRQLRGRRAPGHQRRAVRATSTRSRKGDPVVVETATDWFTYVVDKHQIVRPTDVWVLDAGARPAGGRAHRAR